MNTKTCPVCEARWIDGKHYWATGKEGNELDLAGLVCNNTKKDGCINPCNGREGGQTWEGRMERMNTIMEEFE